MTKSDRGLKQEVAYYRAQIALCRKKYGEGSTTEFSFTMKLEQAMKELAKPRNEREVYKVAKVAIGDVQ